MVVVHHFCCLLSSRVVLDKTACQVGNLRCGRRCYNLISPLSCVLNNATVKPVASHTSNAQTGLLLGPTFVHASGAILIAVVEMNLLRMSHPESRGSGPQQPPFYRRSRPKNQFWVILGIGSLIMAFDVTTLVNSSVGDSSLLGECGILWSTQAGPTIIISLWEERVLDEGPAVPTSLCTLNSRQRILLGISNHVPVRSTPRR